MKSYTCSSHHSSTSPSLGEKPAAHNCPDGHPSSCQSWTIFLNFVIPWELAHSTCYLSILAFCSYYCEIGHSTPQSTNYKIINLVGLKISIGNLKIHRKKGQGMQGSRVIPSGNPYVNFRTTGPLEASYVKTFVVFFVQCCNVLPFCFEQIAPVCISVNSWPNKASFNFFFFKIPNIL